MNSYPPEFLTHPQPLMFVAGLSNSADSRTTRDRSGSVNSAAGSSSRRPSASAGSGSITSGTTSSKVLDPSSAAGSVGLSLKSPVATPGVTPTVLNAPLPTSPPIPGQEGEREASPVKSQELPSDAVEGEVAAEASPQDKEFQRLLSDLRGALGGLGRRAKVWLPPQQRKDFRIALVDKNTRLPIRKVASSSSTESSSIPHSPLSPLTTSSPLYPDGLIAPVWVRKHAELVPSVFVLFLRLYETPPLSEDELAAETADQKAARAKAERAKEQEMDDVLVGEIGDRRRRLGERGIKLTVVLMASTEALDSPNLDPRLSYLRRASALSSKASLFVLTPVPADQLPDFVQSLQDALYDSAMEYYSNHTKRVRRKKARLPANQYGALLGSDRGRALGSQGWGVRYDWKAGWFAEVKGEMDVARRHYEDCWNELARMFASTQTLPPRTKRWAEAKVLADCVAVKICKLLLYEGGGTKVLGPFFVHLKRFGDLSRGWGIGEETFEFWSWIARQYRIFAELLDLAVQAGLQLATPPTAILTSPDPATSPTISEPIPPGKTAVNPLQILQPPAFYFYMAASCTIQRQRRFLAAQAAEEDALGSEAGAASGYVSAAPGYANEKKVDHAGLIVDLLTKAYSLAKDQSPPQNRVGLYLAFRIAETYSFSGQYDQAIRFFERISPNFKLEKWDPVVKQIRELWYEAAQRTGDVESAATMLIEKMCPGSGVDDGERATLQEDLLSILQTTSPSKSDPIKVEMSGESSLLEVSAAFWRSELEAPTSAPFQITIHCPGTVDISMLSFEQLSVSFSDDRPDLIVNNAGGQEPLDGANIINVGLKGENESEPANARLCWSNGSHLVINGQLECRRGPPLSITNVRLALMQGSWNINLRFVPNLPTEWSTYKRSLMPVHDLSSSVRFITRPYDVSMEVSHHPSAFVDELLPVAVKVINKDDGPVIAKLSVFLQPAEEEDGSTIACGGETSRALLEDIDLGSLSSGSTVEKTIILKSPVPSTKIIDFSLHTSGADEPSRTVSEGDQSLQETIHTAVIPVLPPFEMLSRIDATPSGDGDAKTWAMVVSAVLSCPMPRSITIQAISLQNAEASDGVELVSSSLDNASDQFPQVWDQETSYAIYARFKATSVASLRALASAPAFLVLSWRSDEAEDLTETRLPLPPLTPPAPDGPVSARLTPPSLVKLDEPFHLSLELTNLHRTLSASLHIEVTTAENFVWRGSRNIRIPDLLPEEKREFNMELIAVGKTGWCALPKINVWDESSVDGGDERGKEVPIIDAQDGGDVRDGLQVFVRP